MIPASAQTAELSQNYTNSATEENYSGVAIQPDGKIVAVGYYSAGAQGYNMIVTRFNTNYALDTSFGSPNGFVVLDIENANLDDYANEVVLQPDGKIVIAGETGTGSARNSVIVRLNTNGTPDTTFDGDGTKVVAVSSVDSDSFTDVLIAPDSTILASGYTSPVYGGNYRFTLYVLIPTAVMTIVLMATEY